MEFCLIMNHQGEAKILLRENYKSLARISLGMESCIYMGNLNALRDWGHKKLVMANASTT